MSFQNKYQLNLQYKGQRNYIHGSDIYNAINNVASQLTNKNRAFVSNLAFHRFAKKDCDLCLVQPLEKKDYVAKGNIKDIQGNDLQQFWIVESDRDPVGRYDYDEKAIINLALIKDQEIILQEKTDYTPIEETIALTKSLHYKLFPDISGKWVFGQLDLVRPFSVKRNNLRIELKSAKSNRFTMSKIYEDDEFVGNIRFIVGNP